MSIRAAAYRRNDFESLNVRRTFVYGRSRHNGKMVQRAAVKDEASYFCDSCGEEIVVPVDLSAGDEQTYVEDCPVCCRPMVIHVSVDDDGEVSVWGEAE
jgi:hypothetical protein